MIVNTSDLSNINFSEILEDSIDTVRKSIDQTKAIVKWDGEIIPSSLETLTTKEGPYNHQQIFQIICTPEWTLPEN
jgi:hypothetical protein